jgi:Ca2+-binding EF-hand superfamily protein
MMNEAPGPINFTMFLTLFGERLQGTDPEDVIKNAFGCFDEENAGFVNEEKLRELLTTMGDRFSDEEVGESIIARKRISIYFLFRWMKCSEKLPSRMALSTTSSSLGY